MNTSFVDQLDGIYKMDKKGVDPDSFGKNNKVDNDFRVELHFAKVCDLCSPNRAINHLCHSCGSKMANEIKCWKTISTILADHGKGQDKLIEEATNISKQIIDQEINLPGVVGA